MQHVSCILVIFPDGCPSRRRVGAHNLFFIMASPVGATTCWGSVLRHTIFSSGQGLLLALLGTISGEDRLVTSRLAVEESGAVSGGNHLVASPVGAAELLLRVHSAGDIIRRVMFGSFALFLGAVFGGGYSRLAVIDSGAVFGGSHLIASPRTATLRRIILFPGHDVMICTFALLLGAVFGGDHLLASPVDAAECASTAALAHSRSPEANP